MKKENTIYIIMILYILLNLVCVNILFSNVYDSYFELFPVNDSEDTYRLVDMEESVSSFVKDYEKVVHLKDFYNELGNNSLIEYYEEIEQPVEVDEFKATEIFRYGYEEQFESDEIKQILLNYNSWHNNNLCEKIIEGDDLKKSDFVQENYEEIPVILGYEYRDYYNIGDTMDVTLSTDVFGHYKVIGIMNKDTSIWVKQFISDSYACRVGRGTHKAVNRLHDWLKQTDRKPQRFYYLKLDIAKYFYRIDHEVLMDILRKKIADEDLLHVLSVIINCEDTNFGLPLGADIGDMAFDELLGEVGLPIGNLTSQMFANLYLNELDQFCKHKLHLHYYIRYMDDIIILHPDKKYLEKIKNKIADFLGSKLHLQLNKKTCIRPTSMGIEFVGFRIWSTHIKLRKKTAKKLKRRLKYMFAAYHAGEIDKDTLDRSVASYRGILQHFNSYGMRQSLNELYLQEMGKPYPEPEKKPASKCGLFCGYYGSTDDYIKQPEEKEVTDSGSNADA